jgi:hypothetical protein
MLADRSKWIVTPMVLLLADAAGAYLPVECNAEHAAGDLAKSEAVVIGRVIAVQRLGPQEAFDGRWLFSPYLAKVKIGRTLKGPLKTGDEIKIGLGGYLQRAEDNVQPTSISIGTHSGLDLKPNGVYLLCLNRAKGAGSVDGWAPRSCHFSVHHVVLAKDDRTGKAVLSVRAGRWPGARQEAVPLSVFLESKEVAQ